MTIHNLPIIAESTAFLVVRFVEGEAWFWGQYRTKDRAQAVAEDVNGIVIDLENEEA